MLQGLEDDEGQDIRGGGGGGGGDPVSEIKK